MIGHKGHPEVEGTLGQAQGGMYLVETVEDVAGLQVADPDNLAYVTQTTLSVDDAAAVSQALKARFPNIVEPKKSDICYATQNRQDAVKILAPDCDLVLVVGSPNSSNSNRLREVAERKGVAAYLIDGAHSIQPEWLAGRQRIGRRVRAGNPGAAGDRTRQGVGRGIGPHHAGPGGKRGLPAAQGAVAQGAGGTARISRRRGPAARAARNQEKTCSCTATSAVRRPIACASRST